MVKAKRRQIINESVPVAPESGYINLTDEEKNLLNAVDEFLARYNRDQSCEIEKKYVRDLLHTHDCYSKCNQQRLIRYIKKVKDETNNMNPNIAVTRDIVLFGKEASGLTSVFPKEYFEKWRNDCLADDLMKNSKDDTQF